MYLFKLFNYEYLNTYCKWLFLIILLIVLIIIFASIIYIIFIYYIIKWLKNNIDYESFFNYEYNKKTKQILEKYGDYHIKKVYLVKEECGILSRLLINIETLHNNLLMQNNTSLIFEVIMPNKLTKYILLEKKSYVNLSSNFYIKEEQEINQIKQIKRIQLEKKKLTIKSILKDTQDRIGDEKYFNWHIFKNNCQSFTNELLKTIKNKQ